MGWSWVQERMKQYVMATAVGQNLLIHVCHNQLCGLQHIKQKQTQIGKTQ